ncbi:MAG: D-alanyl-D-alanine carboxypeptidase family protein [Ruminococcus flavefaciens]|nr:D-alanyl-D-alanine carboxypeptidase family protein [Ruminococcus flavefaciens]MCM1361377.1 D-alanyl-D-alanine carboxypeptidase family protein [Clostridiales bacterium]MCM1435751.1 D-alanyl-D-alanine carboxypeptidase family protein [Ruminococcus flavefaciens]
MDNNNYQRPRKRVSKETARKRQLIALGVIALLVLIFILLIAKACSKDDTKKGGNTKPTENKNSVTTMATTTQDGSMTTTSTTTAPVTNPDGSNNSGFKLDKYSIYLDIGGTDMPYVQEYPEGSSEADERWSSSDEKVATVDEWGHITAVGAGECYITLRSAADPTKEIQVKVVVADGGVQQTSNDENGTQPVNLAEAPPPPVYDMDGLTYKDGILIANKTYSMPADFNPGLEPICSEHFQALSSAAAKEGLNLWIGSGYRSYYDQEIIYNNYVASDGVEMADTYSARPGFSEHQTGLVIDCNTIDDAFGATPESAWLAEHAHEYGFVIRYPKGKEDITGYQYEPWHIRYVGSKIATECYKRGICLEEYFGIDSYYH